MPDRYCIKKLVCDGVLLVVGENWYKGCAVNRVYICVPCTAERDRLSSIENRKVSPPEKYSAVCGARYRHKNGEHYGCGRRLEGENFPWHAGKACYYDLCKECGGL